MILQKRDRILVPYIAFRAFSESTVSNLQVGSLMASSIGRSGSECNYVHLCHTTAMAEEPTVRVPLAAESLPIEVSHSRVITHHCLFVDLNRTGLKKRMYERQKATTLFAREIGRKHCQLTNQLSSLCHRGRSLLRISDRILQKCQ